MDMRGYLETVRLLPGAQPDGADKDRYQAGDEQHFSVTIMLVSLAFMYSVHNLIAPNMTAMAKSFGFNAYERDAYIGGELTLCFYFPGVFGSLIAGVVSGIADRRMLLGALAIITSLTCVLTAHVTSFRELMWVRGLTGFAIGGALPVVYSLVGDWFPARKRATATAYVTAASGAGVFVGQCVATVLGSSDWRWPFLLIAAPSAIIGAVICSSTKEPVRGGQEDGVETLSLYHNNGLKYMPGFNSRQLRFLLFNRTNMLVTLQAFPGNIPWGVIIVYLHDFLVQDLGLSTANALASIATLAASAFVGVLTGGYVGECLYGSGSKYLGLFGGICNIARAVPFFVLFGWKRLFGPVETSSETGFYCLLMLGGFITTMASACTGAMLLNVNLPEMRGTVVAMYTVLDDFSKGFGTLFVSMLVQFVGGRALAYQLSLLLWVVTGAALLCTWHTYDADESQMRRTLDEAAKESMVVVSKQRAQANIRDKVKAAGAAHFEQTAGRNQKAAVLAPPNSRAPMLWKSHSPESGGAFGQPATAPPAAAVQSYGTNGTTCNNDEENQRSGELNIDSSVKDASARPVKAPQSTTWSAEANMLQRRADLRRAVRAAAEAVATRSSTQVA
mmetsp:Transcript_11016/g.19970  ORF Transcript_11016/g.19970 Transcript_11016/m.19970 type:complete len:617 (+) Transcript_11016:155-2005(+)